MPSDKYHTVLIEKIVAGGLGLGRLTDGMVVLVPQVLPGEKITARVMNRRKDYVSAALHEILTPSPDRIKPPCRFYGFCGGCDLQHAAYISQLYLKRKILAESLHRTTGDHLSGPGIPIRSTIASPAEFGYRQRLRLQVAGDGQFGFYQSGSHRLAAVSECLLAPEAINRVLKKLRQSDTFSELVGQAQAFELLYNPESREVAMLLHFRRKPRAADCRRVTNILGDLDGLALILLMVEGFGLYDPTNSSYVPVPPSLSRTVTPEGPGKDIILTWEIGSFCQVNLRQNENLLNLVLEILRDYPHDRVLDLYCGHGNFSLPIARLAGEVVGIENQNSAVRSGRRNLELNGITNCSFIRGPVDKEVRSLLAAGGLFDTVILDPPRQGAAAVIPGIAGLGAGQMLYISCNPATLARDLALLHANGYEPAFLIPLDMFPQTHHLESITLLKRSGR